MYEVNESAWAEESWSETYAGVIKGGFTYNLLLEPANSILHALPSGFKALALFKIEDDIHKFSGNFENNFSRNLSTVGYKVSTFSADMKC